MASLVQCLRKHAHLLRLDDAEAIRSAPAQFEREGLSARAAAERAILEILADEHEALRDFVGEVVAAGGGRLNGSRRRSFRGRG